MYIIIKNGPDVYITKNFGDIFISSRFFVLTSIPLWMDWRVTDANRAAKGPWCPWVPKKWFILHAILFWRPLYFASNFWVHDQKFFVLHATPWHSTQKCNMFCNTIYFLILAQINYIWTTQIKIYFLSIIWIASSCHVFISSVISANENTWFLWVNAQNCRCEYKSIFLWVNLNLRMLQPNSFHILNLITSTF